jgi:hypothetical protein
MVHPREAFSLVFKKPRRFFAHLLRKSRETLQTFGHGRLRKRRTFSH